MNTSAISKTYRLARIIVRKGRLDLGEGYESPILEVIQEG